jgi:hypothetical protein
LSELNSGVSVLMAIRCKNVRNGETAAKNAQEPFYLAKFGAKG